MWKTGAVPVYWGAPNVHLFLPANSSQHTHQIVEATHKTPRELAALLRRLDRDDDEYLR